MFIEIILLVVLILINGVFSGSEIAFLSIDELYLDEKVENLFVLKELSELYGITKEKGTINKNDLSKDAKNYSPDAQALIEAQATESQVRATIESFLNSTNCVLDYNDAIGIFSKLSSLEAEINELTAIATKKGAILESDLSKPLTDYSEEAQEFIKATKEIDISAKRDAKYNSLYDENGEVSFICECDAPQIRLRAPPVQC